MPVCAVGLRMWCDLAAPEVAPPGAVSFDVVETALLSDGREVVLVDDRGWTSSPAPEAYGQRLTFRDVELGVYNVLLPDWADVDHPLPPELAAAEGTGGAQDWDLLVERLRAQGITATAAELAALPRQLDLGDRLRARLA